MSTALLHAFTECGRGAELARELVSAEVCRETDHRAMFRAASLATALVDEFMRAHCKPFLQVCLTVSPIVDHNKLHSTTINSHSAFTYGTHKIYKMWKVVEDTCLCGSRTN